MPSILSRYNLQVCDSNNRDIDICNILFCGLNGLAPSILMTLVPLFVALRN